MAKYQNLHLADRTLFEQYRTLFQTDIDDAHDVLENSSLQGKQILASDINDATSSISTIETYYNTQVPVKLATLLNTFNGEINDLAYIGEYSSQEQYEKFNIVAGAMHGGAGVPKHYLYMAKDLIPATQTVSQLSISGYQPFNLVGMYQTSDNIIYPATQYYITYNGTNYGFTTPNSVPQTSDGYYQICFDTNALEFSIMDTYYTTSESSTGTQLTLSNNWLFLGCYGGNGDPGLGITFKANPQNGSYEWASALTYDAKDVVSYEDNLYVALSQNQGENPETSTTYWELLFTYDKAIINLSNSSLVNGDIYWEILT